MMTGFDCSSVVESRAGRRLVPTPRLHGVGITVLVAMLAASARAEPVSIAIDAKPVEVYAAQPVDVTVRIESEPGVVVTPPMIGGSLGELTVYDLSVTPDIPADNGNRLRVMNFQVEANAAGDYTLPALTATYIDPRDADSMAGEVRTEPVSLVVKSVLENPQDADPTRFRDIKSVVAVAAPESGGPVWLWVAGGGAGIAMLAVAGLAIARRRSGVMTARQRALAALCDLESSDLLRDGQTDAYYTQLTSIVRRYIEDAFALKAVRLTTPEFLEQAKRDAALTDTDRRLLRECLTAADMVKFARFQPSTDVGDQAIVTARTFIETPRNQEQEKGVAA